jgi:3-hydroxyacyl-[acyl-carrier-protein] dehydratase
MQLTLVDRITELEAGKHITAIKNLSLSESYLEDHFPRFPVMPGVLMLEAMYQAAAWLVRVTDQFAHSMVTLSEANNVKYSAFVEPGETLVVSAELTKREGNVYRLTCQGQVRDAVAVRGRLVLRAYQLAEQNAASAEVDRQLIHSLRQRFQLLYPTGHGSVRDQLGSGSED